MAEFQEVLQQWRRMCQCHNCKECPGRTIGNKDNICLLMKTENRRTEAEVEEIITAWAAEHPEPVYPTWAEWLRSQSVLDDYHGGNACLNISALHPIPADIAEKLGIEPKPQV